LAARKVTHSLLQRNEEGPFVFIVKSEMNL